MDEELQSLGNSHQVALNLLATVHDDGEILLLFFEMCDTYAAVDPLFEGHAALHLFLLDKRQENGVLQSVLQVFVGGVEKIQSHDDFARWSFEFEEHPLLSFEVEDLPVIEVVHRVVIVGYLRHFESVLIDVVVGIVDWTNPEIDVGAHSIVMANFQQYLGESTVDSIAMILVSLPAHLQDRESFEQKLTLFELFEVLILRCG